MVDVAKVFMSGRSQAVRLPKHLRFDCAEVTVTREGEALVLRPRKAEPWANVLAALEGFTEEDVLDMFPNGREQPPMQERPEIEKFFEE